MIGLMLLFPIFLGYSFFFKRLLKIEFSHALIFGTSIVLSVYFIAAFFYFLDSVIYASFALGIGFFIYCIFDFLRHDNIRNIKELFGADVIVFILGMVIYYVSVKDYPSYYFWDEYSLWALALKEMNIYHGLRSLSDPTAVLSTFNPYVKLTTIFHYSLSKILGFKAGASVFSNGFLYFIFCSIALVEKRLFLSVSLYFLLVLFSMYDVIVSINSLHHDATVGCVFGAIIAIYIQSKKYNNLLLSLILIAPLLFILPNIKEVGYWLSYIAIFIIAVDLFCNKNYRYICWVLILLLLPVLSKFIWCNYADSLCTASYGNKCATFKQVPFASIFNLLSINSEQVLTAKSAISYLVNYFYLPEALYIYSLTVIALIFIWQNSKEQLKDFLRTFIILLVGFALYIIFRIDLYLTNFTKGEAEVAACYARYFNSYTYVFCFVAISFIKNSFEKLELQKSLKSIWFYLICIFLSFTSIEKIIHKIKDVAVLSNVDVNPLERQDKLKALIKNIN